MKSTVVLFAMLAVITLALLAASSAGATESVAVDAERPDADSGPTRVEVFLYLIDLTKVDGASQSFTADLFVATRWRDPRLASPGGTMRRMNLDNVWNPRIQIVNQRAVRTSFPDLVDVEPNGTVTARQRYFGDFSTRLDLHDFPLDRHTIGFTLATPGYTSHEIQLVAPDQDGAVARAQQLSIVDWSVGPLTPRASDYQIGASGRSIAGFVGELEVTRKLGFYVSKAFLSVAIIVVMSWVVFWIDPKYAPPRLSVAVTAMLTLIAYRFVLAQLLPPLSYLTRMDDFLLGSTILLLLVLVEVVVSTHLHGTDRPQRALSLDRASRWVFPIAFAALSVSAFLLP